MKRKLISFLLFIFLIILLLLGTYFINQPKGTEKLDTKNVFSNVSGWKEVDKESIIRKNPDILISTEGISKEEYYEVIKERDGFSEVNAVKNERVETVNGDEISRPGPRIDEGMKELRDAIYKR